ncbi:MAG TPA: 1,4-dihydroxy-2-naphthoate octaprenyltransferase [Cryomorphaceae bacterium]|nr:1,4-dihydroxy-2-naphthoate octaprenyltransferase [Cryomorphaceae bacterium]|tara:strand:+ start:2125 stop:3042 length:918 start_codon:yes stop_codon:yes gene_type:complete
MAQGATLKQWIKAARLRTLPLAFAVIILGSGLGYLHTKSFSIALFGLALLTSCAYQILSNYANDLGDGIKGTDNNKRGEQRAVASGLISIRQMRLVINLFTLLSFMTGSILVYMAFKGTIYFYLFMVLNVSAVWAARSYTIGRNPYAYWGGGDLFVILFFGLVGVMGSSALQTGTLHSIDALPALVAGAMSVSVLTCNNLRDREGDAHHGKRTLVVRYGEIWGRGYFKVLLITSILLSLVFSITASIKMSGYYPIVAHMVFQFVLRGQFKKFTVSQTPEEYDALLKPLALTTLLYCITTSMSFFF